ncbi:MAG: TraR/DksA family transcriptional regulator [Acidobacteria bacterium]|nr:TraR/DksA family transcriptional regulator [Acidobacteriota bacterium]
MQNKRVHLRKQRQKLEQARNEILARIHRVTSHGRAEEICAEPSDSGDIALSSYTKEFLYKLNDVERGRLLEIEAALQRIDQGDYGRCVDCGGVLPARRLEVVPWASRCTPCQEAFEQSQQAEDEAEEAANF